PMYDFAHPLQDAMEGVTHSLCSLEYVDHRPLYDWVVEHCETPHIPHQYEFGRLNITNTIMSKRYLKQLVDLGLVRGYDDPRMPTLAGLRRRGFTPEAIKSFILSTGLSRINSTVSSEMLETAVRSDLVGQTKRVMAILDPIKVIITNYDQDIEEVEVEYNPDRPEMGSRKLPFGREIYISREDFLEEKPNKHWKRLSLGIEVRLMHAYFIKAEAVRYNDHGQIVEIDATYDVRTKSGSGFDERKPNGNIHFVEASRAVPATFRLFEPLMVDSDSTRDLVERLNPESWKSVQGFVEPALKGSPIGEKFQFIRLGYFRVDEDTTTQELIFNRIVELKSRFQ
ncbi:MAG: glutamate--tRNA ligase family protein, partial [Candidatus Izemoplasmatales bacterium]|nr:glutamate--tRNA ligase family protein [Candidatus Izemoplasmatales bacterium]